MDCDRISTEINASRCSKELQEPVCLREIEGSTESFRVWEMAIILAIDCETYRGYKYFQYLSLTPQVRFRVLGPLKS